MLHSSSRIRVFSVIALTTAVVSGASAVRAQNQPAIHDAVWVESRIKELQPTPDERRIDEIGWVRDILGAKSLARNSGRPVFLFTHDGRINTGRC